MSIEIGNDNTSAARPAAAAAPQQQAQTAQPSFSQPTQRTNMNQLTKGPTLTSMASRIPAPLAATPEAEALRIFLETLREVTKDGINLYDVSLLAINGRENSLAMSIVVLAVRAKNNGVVENERGLTYHTMLLADTMRQIVPQQVQIQGHTITPQIVPGDAYDDKMREVILNRLRAEFPQVQSDRFFEAEAEVIPKDFPYKNADLVRAMIRNALIAAASELVVNTDDSLPDIALGADARNLNIQVRVATRQNQVSDEVGAELRSDIRIEMTESRGGNTQQGNVVRSLNSDEQVTPILTLGGFIDLAYSPAAGAGVNNQYMAPVNPGQQVARQLYNPRLVITRMDTSEMRTLPGQLLGLTTIPALTEGYAWFSQFQSNKDNSFNFHDIGAIGYELNLDNNPSQIGERIDTRSNTFNDLQLAQLLHAFVNPDVWVSMDVEECGPSTYWNSVYLAAAKGSPDANAAIFEAANTLTNGLFLSKFHNGQGPAVLNDQNRIHLGTYIDKTGNKRDLRDVDYLAILNWAGDKDAQAIKDWSDSFNRIDYPLELRLDARWRMISEVTGHTAELRAFAQRITFDTENFLKPFFAAVKATGFLPRLTTPFQDVAGQPRATAGYLQQTGLGAAVSGMYTRGFGQQQAVVNPLGGGFGRWAR